MQDFFKGAPVRGLTAALLALFIWLGPAGAVTGDRAPTADAVQRLIVSEAVRNGTVPPTLALAVARVESNFAADVTSSAGARGVMQIMPATALGEFGVGADRLYDAQTNIRLGIAFLARLYRAYGNRWDLALSHYNGGSLKRVGGRWQAHGFTRKYVADVMRYWNGYQRARWAQALVRATEIAPSASPTPRADPAQVAADYAFLETPAIDNDWRDYLNVAERYLDGSAQPVSVDFSPAAAADPEWHYPLNNGPSTGSRVGTVRPPVYGSDRFLNSAQTWRVPGQPDRFH